MGPSALIMTRATDDLRAGGHIVSGGPDRLPVMPGQDIARRCGMTNCTANIRRHWSVM